LAGAVVLLVIVVLLLSSSSISNAAPPGLVETSEHASVISKHKKEVTPADKSKEDLPPVVVVDEAKEEPAPVKKNPPKVVKQPPQNEVVAPKKIPNYLDDKAGNLRGKELFKDENAVEPPPTVKNVVAPEKPLVVHQQDTGDKVPQHELPHVNIVGGGLPNEHSTVFYNHHRNGKAGAVVEDMLMAHAYAFHSKGGYGGACGHIKPEKKVEFESLLAAIGLKESLPFACPADFPLDKVTRRSMVQRDAYRKDDVRIWTPDYVDFLKTQIQYPPPHMDVNDHRYTIAVHIRRGDVTPCRRENQGYERYLSNLHFQMVIDKYYQEGARVVIFSQEKSFEPWDSFREKRYELWLDTDVADAWKHMLTADLVILSRSSFSFIPGMASKGKVIYTPYWHKPLRRWIHVDKEIMEKSDAETDRLQQTCPKKNKFGGAVLSHEAGHHKEAHHDTGLHHAGH
jgi:hypothetical protein